MRQNSAAPGLEPVGTSAGGDGSQVDTTTRLLQPRKGLGLEKWSRSESTLENFDVRVMSQIGPRPCYSDVASRDDQNAGTFEGDRLQISAEGPFLGFGGVNFVHHRSQA